MFSTGAFILISLLALIVVFTKVISSLGFYVFIATSLLTYKIFFKRFQEFVNGLAYFITPKIIKAFKSESKQGPQGEGKFLMWFCLNFLFAYGANHLFGLL